MTGPGARGSKTVLDEYVQSLHHVLNSGAGGAPLPRPSSRASRHSARRTTPSSPVRGGTVSGSYWAASGPHPPFRATSVRVRPSTARSLGGRSTLSETPFPPDAPAHIDNLESFPRELLILAGETEAATRAQPGGYVRRSGGERAADVDVAHVERYRDPCFDQEDAVYCSGGAGDLGGTLGDGRLVSVRGAGHASSRSAGEHRVVRGADSALALDDHPVAREQPVEIVYSVDDVPQLYHVADAASRGGPPDGSGRGVGSPSAAGGETAGSTGHFWTSGACVRVGEKTVAYDPFFFERGPRHSVPERGHGRWQHALVADAVDANPDARPPGSLDRPGPRPGIAPAGGGAVSGAGRDRTSGARDSANDRSTGLDVRGKSRGDGSWRGPDRRDSVGTGSEDGGDRLALERSMVKAGGVVNVDSIETFDVGQVGDEDEDGVRRPPRPQTAMSLPSDGEDGLLPGSLAREDCDHGGGSDGDVEDGVEGLRFSRPQVRFVFSTFMRKMISRLRLEASREGYLSENCSPRVLADGRIVEPVFTFSPSHPSHPSHPSDIERGGRNVSTPLHERRTGEDMGDAEEGGELLGREAATPPPPRTPSRAMKKRDGPSNPRGFDDEYASRVEDLCRFLFRVLPSPTQRQRVSGAARPGEASPIARAVPLLHFFASLYARETERIREEQRDFVEMASAVQRLERARTDAMASHEAADAAGGPDGDHPAGVQRSERDYLVPLDPNFQALIEASTEEELESLLFDLGGPGVRAMHVFFGCRPTDRSLAGKIHGSPHRPRAPLYPGQRDGSPRHKPSVDPRPWSTTERRKRLLGSDRVSVPSGIAREMHPGLPWRDPALVRGGGLVPQLPAASPPPAAGRRSGHGGGGGRGGSRGSHRRSHSGSHRGSHRGSHGGSHGGSQGGAPLGRAGPDPRDALQAKHARAQAAEESERARAKAAGIVLAPTRGSGVKVGAPRRRNAAGGGTKSRRTPRGGTPHGSPSVRFAADSDSAEGKGNAGAPSSADAADHGRGEVRGQPEGRKRHRVPYDPTAERPVADLFRLSDKPVYGSIRQRRDGEWPELSSGKRPSTAPGPVGAGSQGASNGIRAGPSHMASSSMKLRLLRTGPEPRSTTPQKKLIKSLTRNLRSLAVEPAREDVNQRRSGHGAKGGRKGAHKRFHQAIV